MSRFSAGSVPGLVKAVGFLVAPGVVLAAGTTGAGHAESEEGAAHEHD